ncbi:MAG: sterol desaturase family protein [Polyangiaceae bacterium]
MGMVEWVIPVAAMGYAIVATSASLSVGVPGFLIALIAVAPLALAALALERVYPERDEYSAPDQPLRTEVAHYLFDYNAGYAISIAGCAALQRALGDRSGWLGWPSSWPVVLQVALAGVLAEATSYWQHRLVHRVPWLWRFHALHHQGQRLNVFRTGRFHFIDIAPGAFLSFAPLVLLRAPESMSVWVVTLSGALGVLEHANVRMRTPRWLDFIVCTPAVHRHHHSRDARESGSNFGTVTMLFDILFGTYQRPRPAGPLAVGVEEAPLNGGFWRQLLSPFRPTRASDVG